MKNWKYYCYIDETVDFFPCFNVYSAFHIMSKYEGIRTFMSACMNEMLVEQRSLSTTTKVRRPNRTDALNIPDSREKKILWRHILSMQYPWRAYTEANLLKFVIILKMRPSSNDTKIDVCESHSK